MQNELQKLGFSKEEAKIYLAVLEIGQTTAGPIVKKTGLHRQIVYDVLEKLKNKELLTETLKSNRKNWQASNPALILNKIKERLNLAENIIPDLIAKQKLSHHKQEVRVFEGVEGFKALHENNLSNQPKKSEVYVIGSSGWDWVGLMQKARYFGRFEKERMVKDMIFKLVFFEKERKKTQELIKKHYLSQPKEKRRVFKFLPDSYESPVGIQVWQDNVTLIIYSPIPLLIQIKNDLAVKNFTKYFEILWKMARR